MAYEMPVHDITLPADSSVVPSSGTAYSNQFKAVYVTSSGTAALVSSTSQYPIGIMQNDPVAASYETSVRILGVSKAMYGGSVTAGNSLTINSSGQLVVASGNAYVLGIALESGASGEIHAVELAARGYIGAPGNQVLNFHFNLADLSAAGNVAAYSPGRAGSIASIQATMVSPTTDKSKSVVLSLTVTSTAVTGGAVTISTNSGGTNGTIGTLYTGTSITGTQTFAVTDTIYITLGSSITAFSYGEVDVKVLLN